MDVGSIALAFLAMQGNQQQSAMSMEMMKFEAQTAASLAQMIDAAAQNANRLANVGPGVGTALDISA